MTVPSPTALAPVHTPTPLWWPLVRWLLVLAGLLPLVLFAAPSVLKLPRYDVSGGQIVARSVLSRTVIPKGTAVEKTSLGLTRRIYGSNLPGYTVGRFDSGRGEVAVYSDGSSPANGLLFATRPPTYLTPADPETLLAVWQHGDTATFRPARRSGPTSFWLLLLLLPALGVAITLLSKPRLTYTIAGDILTVKTRSSTTTFPRQSTQASLTGDGLGVRMFGTAMPGYYTGTFSTRSGNVQAAASSAKPAQALILERGGKRYYLTPGDPAAVAAWFMQAN